MKRQICNKKKIDEPLYIVLSILLLYPTARNPRSNIIAFKILFKNNIVTSFPIYRRMVTKSVCI